MPYVFSTIVVFISFQMQIFLFGVSPIVWFLEYYPETPPMQCISWRNSYMLFSVCTEKHKDSTTITVVMTIDRILKLQNLILQISGTLGGPGFECFVLSNFLQILHWKRDCFELLCDEIFFWYMSDAEANLEIVHSAPAGFILWSKRQKPDLCSHLELIKRQVILPNKTSLHLKQNVIFSFWTSLNI